MKNLNLLSIFCLFIVSFGCVNMNVVLKNTKNNTVQVAKLDHLFELGDTILFNNLKHEIIRKKLKNGNIVKREPLIKSSKPTQIPPPSKKP
jgi:hypothetical protein